MHSPQLPDRQLHLRCNAEHLPSSTAPYSFPDLQRSLTLFNSMPLSERRAADVTAAQGFRVASKPLLFS